MHQRYLNSMEKFLLNKNKAFELFIHGTTKHTLGHANVAQANMIMPSEKASKETIHERNIFSASKIMDMK
jgi:hypothetical protein